MTTDDAVCLGAHNDCRTLVLCNVVLVEVVVFAWYGRRFGEEVQHRDVGDGQHGSRRAELCRAMDHRADAADVE